MEDRQTDIGGNCGSNTPRIMKDPAFLFYPGDWITGTMGMTLEEKGAYLELLVMQFSRGHMTSHMIGLTVGQLFGRIQDKFKQDDDGLWYNERLDYEKEARIRFTQSRRNNLSGTNQYTKKDGHMTSHMGGHKSSHMEDENILYSKKVFKEKKEKSTKVQIEKFNPLDHIPDDWRKDQFAELWADFEEMRRKAKKPLTTDRAIKGCLNDLIRFSGGSYQKAEEIALNSIKAGWLAFYEPKQTTKTQTGHDPRYSHTFIKDKA